MAISSVNNQIFLSILCVTPGDIANSKEFLDCRKALALDVPERVAMTLKNATQYWRGNTEKISQNVDIFAAYMLLCYEGNHKSCRSAPLARLTGCTDTKKGRNWFSRSFSLSCQGISELQLTKLILISSCLWSRWSSVLRQLISSHAVKPHHDARV